MKALVAIRVRVFIFGWGALLLAAFLRAGVAQAAPDPHDPLLIRSYGYGFYCAAFSPDGNFIVKSDGGQDVKLLDANTGELVRSFYVPSSVRTVDFSSDNLHIIAGSLSQTYPYALIFNAWTGEIFQSLPGHQSVGYVAFSPDGAKALTTSALDGKLFMWNVASGQLLFTITADIHEACGAVFSADGLKFLANQGYSDYRLGIYDAATGTLLKTITDQIAPGFFGSIEGFAFSPDGKRVVTSGTNGVHLWNAETGDKIRTITTGSSLSPVAYSRDGTRLLILESSWVADLLDAESGQVLLTFQHGRQVTQLMFTPDGTRILTLTADGIAYLWRATPPAAAHAWAMYE